MVEYIVNYFENLEDHDNVMMHQEEQGCVALKIIKMNWYENIMRPL